MKLKFESGEKVLYKDTEAIVKVARKNFSTNSLIYLLDTGEQVPESQLKKIKETISLPKRNSELEEAHETYEKLFHKQVPVAKKNKLDWILKKINEAKETTEQSSSKVQKATPYQMLSALDREGMEALIIEKNLDMDIGDYENDEELLVALAEELGVEIPD